MGILKNDKTTAKDELALSAFMIISFIIGILLMTFKPEFGFIKMSFTVSFGALLVAITFIMIPCIAWRLYNNDKNSDNSEEK